MIFGDYRIEIVPDAQFRLDGGAMFGVVPRTLWERVATPDEANRIRLGANCLLIETNRELILIETGVGAKWSPKMAAIYDIDQHASLAQSLGAIGYQPEDVTVVVNTHLHFDHAGGNTKLDGDGRTVATFPRARYLVSRAEYEHAVAPHERDRASYLAVNWQPLIESGQLELRDDAYEVAPGLTMETVPGHSRTMQCARLVHGGRTLYVFADLVPTRAHLPLAWIMGYDLYPVETLENKRRLLADAVREDWLCYFYHDPDRPLCRLADDGGRLRAIAVE